MNERTKNMNGYGKHKVKLAIGILISALCMYLAFRKVDTLEMSQAFRQANYWYMVPAVAVLFFSHFLRAFRWRYLLDPVVRLDTKSLFSSLIIGYAANALVPAHLGEFLRAYVLSKKRQVLMSPVFATIVVERIIDVFSLLALMLLAMFIHPFPDWAIKSGYIMLFGTLGLFMFFAFLKKATSARMAFLGLIMKPLPQSFEYKAKAVVEKFLAGILPMKHWHDYVTLIFLSLIIWFSYGLGFFFCLHAFDFVDTYHLKWSTSLILLVVTTIAVVVPSSPGYVGTYHYLCQITLAMFGVSAGPALSFATVVHGVNILPVFIVGFFLAHFEGVAILKMAEDAAAIEQGVPP